jgi:hypothetical protein
MNFDAAALVLSPARSVDVCNMNAHASNHVIKSVEILRNVPVNTADERPRQLYVMLSHYNVHGTPLSVAEDDRR